MFTGEGGSIPGTAKRVKAIFWKIGRESSPHVLRLNTTEGVFEVNGPFLRNFPLSLLIHSISTLYLMSGDVSPLH